MKKIWVGIVVCFLVVGVVGVSGCISSGETEIQDQRNEQENQADKTTANETGGTSGVFTAGEGEQDQQANGNN